MDSRTPERRKREQCIHCVVMSSSEMGIEQGGVEHDRGLEMALGLVRRAGTEGQEASRGAGVPVKWST